MKLMRFCLVAAVTVLLYFVVMSNLAHNRVDFDGIQFVIELFTIPMFLLMPVILFIAIRYFKRSPVISIASLFLVAITIAFIAFNA